MNGNDFMAWVLRSPFHGMLSNGMMLITVTGRKTGKTYITPVGYYVEANTCGSSPAASGSGGGICRAGRGFNCC